MRYDVDNEHHELMKTVGDKVPVMTELAPSQYSDDGKHLYLCSVGRKVGSEAEDYEEAIRVFEEVWECRHQELIGSLTDKLIHAANAARDQNLVAQWIRSHFIEQVSPEIEARLDKEPEKGSPQDMIR